MEEKRGEEEREEEVGGDEGKGEGVVNRKIALQGGPTHTIQLRREGNSSGPQVNPTRDGLRNQQASPAPQADSDKPPPTIDIEDPTIFPTHSIKPWPTSSSQVLPFHASDRENTAGGTGCYDPNPCSGRRLAPQDDVTPLSLAG